MSDWTDSLRLDKNDILALALLGALFWVQRASSSVHTDLVLHPVSGADRWVTPIFLESL